MTHGLQSAFIGTFNRRRRDNDRPLQTEFAGASRELACIGFARQEVALFKDLIVISIGVGTISMGFRGLGHGIDQPIHLASTARCSAPHFPDRSMPTLLSFVRRTAFHRLSTSDLRAELVLHYT